MKKKICCIFDQAAHYRSAIYRLMDETLDFHFYISRWDNKTFKQMDYNVLSCLKGVSKNISIIGKFYWQSNVIHLLFKPYKKYLLIGSPYNLTVWAILILSIFLNKKVYLWTHGWYGDESFIKVFLKRIFFLLSTKVFLYGEYAKNLMIASKINPKKLVCIFNSLDYIKQREIYNNLKLTNVYKNYFKNSHPVIIFIGRLQKEKKLHLLVNSINILRKKNIHCNLIFIGKGSNEVELKTLVNECRLENNIWFYGECYSEVINGELLYNSNICVSPGNIGLTAIHALSYGTPSITHNNFKNQGPEFESIIPGYTGDFFLEDSEDDLAIKISDWLNFSENNREKIRQNCIKVIDEKYNPINQLKILVNNIK